MFYITFSAPNDLAQLVPDWMEPFWGRILCREWCSKEYVSMF